MNWIRENFTKSFLFFKLDRVIFTHEFFIFECQKAFGNKTNGNRYENLIKKPKSAAVFKNQNEDSSKFLNYLKKSYYGIRPKFKTI